MKIDRKIFVATNVCTMRRSGSWRNATNMHMSCLLY